jgi:hypothetical protein
MSRPMHALGRPPVVVVSGTGCPCSHARARGRSGGGAIAWHRGGCQLDGGPNGNGAGRGGRDGADETAEQDRSSNPAPQDFWVSLQLEYQQLE